MLIDLTPREVVLLKDGLIGLEQEAVSWHSRLISDEGKRESGELQDEYSNLYKRLVETEMEERRLMTGRS